MKRLIGSNVVNVYCFFNDPATTEIYTLSLHRRSSDLVRMSLRNCVRREDGLDERHPAGFRPGCPAPREGRRRLRRDGLPRSEEHTSELQTRQYSVCRLLLEKK